MRPKEFLDPTLLEISNHLGPRLDLSLFAHLIRRRKCEVSTLAAHVKYCIDMTFIKVVIETPAPNRISTLGTRMET